MRPQKRDGGEDVASAEGDQRRAAIHLGHPVVALSTDLGDARIRAAHQLRVGRREREARRAAAD